MNKNFAKMNERSKLAEKLLKEVLGVESDRISMFDFNMMVGIVDLTVEIKANMLFKVVTLVDETGLMSLGDLIDYLEKMHNDNEEYWNSRH